MRPHLNSSVVVCTRAWGMGHTPRHTTPHHTVAALGGMIRPPLNSSVVVCTSMGHGAHTTPLSHWYAYEGHLLTGLQWRAQKLSCNRFAATPTQATL